MVRLARLVIPGFPHHGIQRGNGWTQIFFSNEDYANYRDLHDPLSCLSLT